MHCSITMLLGTKKNMEQKETGSVGAEYQECFLCKSSSKIPIIVLGHHHYCIATEAAIPPI